MAFNVQDFRASLQFDGARASLFEVSLTFPAIVATGGAVPGAAGSASQQITFKAKSSSLPGDSVSSIPVNYFGREVKVAGTRSFTDWSFVVINDEDFIIRNSFERWMSGLNSHVGNLRMGPMATARDYQVDAWITQFAKTGEPIKTYRMVGAFPIDVSAIDVDWASGDQIEEFSVTFAYQWWESLVSTDSTTAISGIQTF